MPKHPPFTEADKQTLKALHSEGLTLGQIAHNMGRSRATISRYAKKLGLQFDRSQTAAATKAKRVDAAAARAQLKLDLLADAQRLRAQLFAPTTVYNFGGRDNVYREHELPQPPAETQRATMTAIGIAVGKSIDLERVDQHDDLDKPAVDRWLDQLLGNTTAEH